MFKVGYDRREHFDDAAHLLKLGVLLCADAFEIDIDQNERLNARRVFEVFLRARGTSIVFGAQIVVGEEPNLLPVPFVQAAKDERLLAAHRSYQLHEIAECRDRVTCERTLPDLAGAAVRFRPAVL
jgi:hypothetical protein